ncbi:MAG TPA: malic enzyme-like NAD(P)-binding protein, partial [Candidatus Saccharimonadales bacterium]
YYSPGVAAVSSLIAEHPDQLRHYTWTNNLVAVISNGSAVLGLGNIGPKAAMPVMEGKSLLFKKFANIDSVPIVLNATTADEIVAAVTAIAPSFGAINLEDIAAPICFEVEERLKAQLDIPVFHDDQHGTAIVTLAGIINALKVKKTLRIEDARICIVGAGAAGNAIALLLHKYGAKDIVVVDSKGIISTQRTDLDDKKQQLAALNQRNRQGDLTAAVNNADIFIGVSKAGLLTPELVASMRTQPIIFALANPTPEIMPDLAKQAGALIVATGRSDFPNQINNAVAFPGIFRGALDNNVTGITDDHKIAAAEAIAALVEQPSADEIIPSVFNEKLVPAIARVIK